MLNELNFKSTPKSWTMEHYNKNQRSLNCWTIINSFEHADQTWIDLYVNIKSHFNPDNANSLNNNRKRKTEETIQFGVSIPTFGGSRA